MCPRCARAWWVGHRTRPSRRRRARRRRARSDVANVLARKRREGDASHVAGKASTGGEVERAEVGEPRARARRQRARDGGGETRTGDAKDAGGRSGPMWARMGAKAASVRLEALRDASSSSARATGTAASKRAPRLRRRGERRARSGGFSTETACDPTRRLANSRCIR